MKTQIVIFLSLLFFAEKVSSQTNHSYIVSKWTPIVQKRASELGLKKFNSVYIRTFKMDEAMELWLSDGDKWVLYKTYRICLVSGIPGRKSIQGDRQIPEGIYYISQYNPNSSYHLSLKINYPNKADYAYSDSTSPGDEIYIHGGCVSVGCIPITDEMIEEVWTICKISQDAKIDVHIFSGRFDTYSNIRKLETFSYTEEDYKFQEQMKKVFFYFEHNKKIPKVEVDFKGRYVIIN